MTIIEILHVKNLWKVYGTGENKVEALKKIHFSVQKGEFVSIVGASGSGKSTLLHLIGGLDEPTSGEVIIDGESIFEYNEEKLAIFQRRKKSHSYFNSSVLPALLDYEEIGQTYLNEIIGIFGLSDRREHLPSQQSGGQQQRVAIGLALFYKPTIILADEPTGNLDSKNSKEVVKLLKLTARKYHKTLILITMIFILLKWLRGL